MTARRLVQAGTAAVLASMSLLFFGGAAPATAQSPGTIGIRLLDAPTSRAGDPRARLYIVDHLSPGTTISRRVEVSNDTDREQVVQLYPAAASISSGSFQFGEGRAGNELTTWTKVEPAALTLGPGAKGLATATIAVAPNASPGERYAVVWAEVAAPPPAGGGIGTVNRVGIRIYLSVGPGGEPASEFVIAGLEPRRADDGSPMVAATVRNTGGRALDLSGKLRLENGPGALAAGPFPAKLGTTLGIGQSEPVLVTLDRAVPDGPWDAEMTLTDGLVEHTASARLTFPDPSRQTAPASARSEDGGGTSPLVWLAPSILAVAILAVAILGGRRLRRRSG